MKLYKYKTLNEFKKSIKNYFTIKKIITQNTFIASRD